MKNILLIEDDESLNSGITFMLKKEKYNVFSAMNIKEATDFFYNNTIHLIISDVTLPDGNGFSFCEEIRKTSDVFIMFLTALDEELNIVTGYNIGADDYICKPFSLIVFISKVNALMKRVDKNSTSNTLVSKDIIFLCDNMKIFKSEKEIVLSKTEYKLLKYMMENNKQILTKEQILECLWDAEGKFVYDNAVAVNIRRLREKVEDDPANPTYIKTIRGLGYMWTEGCVKR